MSDELNANPIPEFEDNDRQEPETFNMSDLWATEDDDVDEANFEGFDENIPTVRVITAGRAPVTVPLPPAAEGEVPSDTVANILDRVGISIRAGQAEVFVDGSPAGMDTIVFANSSVTPVGAVKGG